MKKKGPTKTIKGMEKSQLSKAAKKQFTYTPTASVEISSILDDWNELAYN